MQGFRIVEIYCVTNLLNGKQYIGQTVKSTQIRWKGHVHSAIVRCSKFHLHNAIRKYGAEGFKVEVIRKCTLPLANYFERYFIARYNTLAPGGYNLTTGGDLGCQWSDANKAKRSKSAKKMWQTEDHRLKVSAGHKLAATNPQYFERKQIAMKLVWGRPEYRKKMFTTEHRKRMSDAARFRYADPEQRQKLLSNFRLSDPIVRQKMSESAKRRWANAYLPKERLSCKS